MKKYDNYKDSGIEWIGDIPEHWDVKRIGSNCLLTVPQRDKPKDLNGEIPWLRIEDFEGKYISESKSGQGVSIETINEMNLKVYPVGTVLTACSCTMGKTAIVTKPLITNQTFIGITPNENLYSDFLYYFLISSTQYLNSISTGAIQSYLSRDEFSKIKIPFPILEVQKQIANYLDHKTTQIDTLISKKQQFISLLQEERIAVINQAVTKGLDPKVKMKDSGIEWLGEIPEHWEVSRIKYVSAKIGSGVTPRGGAEVYETSGIPLLRSQNVYFDGFRLDNVAYITTDVHDSMNNSKVLKGDVLLNITGGSIERCYFVTDEFEDANVNQHVCIVRPNEFILTEYLYYILSSEIGQLQIDLCQTGGNREALNFEQLKKFLFALPSIEEQSKIISKIQKIKNTIDNAITKSLEEIELLKEYKTALISQVVTGKVDVREEILN